MFGKFVEFSTVKNITDGSCVVTNMLRQISNTQNEQHKRFGCDV